MFSPFCPFWGKREFSSNFGSLILTRYRCTKFKKNTNEQIPTNYDFITTDKCNDPEYTRPFKRKLKCENKMSKILARNDELEALHSFRNRLQISLLILSKFKDTVKAHFGYRNTLLQTTTLNRLFYLFQNYTCVLLMDVL